ncbi:aspartic peptidase domain-containing protein [Chytriomyces sp. MP71]|nr:aspartic peptidase domain-containing protein [Chytriomyces sp. MP71]
MKGTDSIRWLPFLVSLVSGQDRNAPSGLIRLPLQKVQASTPISRASDFASKDAVYTGNMVVAKLDNRADFGYYVDITIGTPGQPSRLVVDTGSNQMWVTSRACAVASLCSSSDNDSFDPTASSSYLDQSAGRAENITYGKGSVAGRRSKDTFSLGGSFHMPATPFLLVSREDATLYAQSAHTFTGILGLAFVNGMGALHPALAAQPGMQARTVLHSMVMQGLIARPVFSLILTSVGSLAGQGVQMGQGGELVLGGVDPFQHSGALTWYPVAMNVGAGYYWSLELTDVQLAGSRIVPDALLGRIYAVMDSGSSFINIDSMTFQNLYDKLKSAIPTLSRDQMSNLITLASCTDMATLPTLSFQFGGSATTDGTRYFQLAASDYVMNVSGTCVVGIVPAAPTQKDGSVLWIVGDVFLRRVFSAYDLNGQVGLAYSVNMDSIGMGGSDPSTVESASGNAGITSSPGDSMSRGNLTFPYPLPRSLGIPLLAAPIVRMFGFLALCIF